MHRRTLQAKLQSGSSVIFGQMVTSSTVLAETMAHQEFDALLFDLQHGDIDVSNAVPLFQAISGTSVAALARIPWNDPPTIMKLLDAGAHGLICPMVNNRDEAEAFVSAASYPPRGNRSYGPLRAHLSGGGDYAATANDDIVKIAMIETASGVQNLESIISTPGLNGIYIGPSDLSWSLGYPRGADWGPGPVRDIIDSIRQIATANGTFAGIYVHSAEYGREMLDAGFNFVVLQSDVVFVENAAASALEILGTERADHERASREAV